MSRPDPDPIRQQRRDASRVEREAREARQARAAARKRRLGILGIVGAVAAVLVALLLVLDGPDDAPPTTAGEAITGQSAGATLLDGIPQSGRTLGSPKAPVTLVEFADLQCPFCRQYAADALPTVIRDYVRTGKVRLEFRPRTFLGPDSVTAARTVVAAGREDKLWNVLDLLYANQGEENSGWVTPALLAEVTAAAGAKGAVAAQGDASVRRDLAAADALAAKNGLDGTPSFLLGPTGGELQPLQVQALTPSFFSSALDRALAR